MTSAINLPPITAHDHPECMVMKWSDLELSAIKRYAEQSVLADRAEQQDRKPDPLAPRGWRGSMNEKKTP